MKIFYLFLYCSILQSSIIEIRESINLCVRPISELDVHEGITSLKIGYNQAVPGEKEMLSPSLSSNTYSYTSIDSLSLLDLLTLQKKGKKISAKLNTPLKKGITLLATMQAPKGAISLPNVSLTNLKFEPLVKAIPLNSKAEDLTITFVLKSLLETGPISETNVELSFLLEDE